MGKMDEQILVVDRHWLFDGESSAFQGVVDDPKTVRELMVKMNNTYEVRRGDAEENPDWKQPITYCIIKRGQEVFMYRRLIAGNEKRLHDQLSIGVGGHMNNLDDLGDWRSNVVRNLLKELNEELHINFNDLQPPKVKAFINDDTNEVGRVHIGLLVVMEVSPQSEVSVRETDKLLGSWVSINELKNDNLYSQLENWSKLALEVL